jgi:hypothetical protein
MYRIAYHRVVEKQLQQCIDALVVAGWDKKELTKRLEDAERRLKRDPSSCGEPVYNIRQLDLVVSVFCLRPFSIQFALHEKSRSILVRRISLMTLEGK